MTQKQLAQAAGISIGLLRDLEQGRTQSPLWRSVEALAAALGLGPGERAHVAAAWQRDGALARLDAGAPPAAAGPPTVRVLGPLAAEQSGRPLDLGSVRARTVLAVLALRGEAGVSSGEIIDILWPSGVPASAPSIIQGHMSRLRRVLTSRNTSPAAPLITWTGVSYRLQCDPHRCRLDYLDFKQLADRGAKAAAAGAASECCDYFESALQLLARQRRVRPRLPAA